MAKIKICGITNADDLSRVVFYGADAVGFIFTKKSPRYVSPSRAKKLIESLPPFITPVGVFVNQKEGAVRDIIRFTGIQAVQFHGDETPAYCKRFKDKGLKVIKAFRVDEGFMHRDVKKYKVDAYLFDTASDEAFGGTGKTFNWDLVADYDFGAPVILSGGLGKDNIIEAIEKVKPFAVDVNSSLEEQPGKKLPAKIREFFEVISV